MGQKYEVELRIIGGGPDSIHLAAKRSQKPSSITELGFRERV